MPQLRSHWPRRAGRRLREPGFQSLHLGGELRRFAHNVPFGQQSIGLKAALTPCPAPGGRGEIGGRLAQPKVNLLSVELAHGLEVQRGAAKQRDHLVLLLGPDLQLSPTGLELLARPVGHLAPQPARTSGKQLKSLRVVGRSRSITQAGRADLVGVLVQHHLLSVFQIDLSVDQVVLQSLGPDLQVVQRRIECGGRALGLDAGRLEIKARARPSSRAAGYLLAGGREGRRPREEDREQLATHVVGRAVGLNPQHVHLVAKGGLLLDQIEAERSAAGDLDRRGVRGKRAQHRRACRAVGGCARPAGLGGRLAMVGGRGRAHVQMHPLDVLELELLDAADVRPFLVPARGPRRGKSLISICRPWPEFGPQWKSTSLAVVIRCSLNSTSWVSTSRSS